MLLVCSLLAPITLGEGLASFPIKGHRLVYSVSKDITFWMLYGNWKSAVKVTITAEYKVWKVDRDKGIYSVIHSARIEASPTSPSWWGPNVWVRGFLLKSPTGEEVYIFSEKDAKGTGTEFKRGRNSVILTLFCSRDHRISDNSVINFYCRWNKVYLNLRYKGLLSEGELGDLLIWKIGTEGQKAFFYINPEELEGKPIRDVRLRKLDRKFKCWYLKSEGSGWHYEGCYISEGMWRGVYAMEYTWEHFGEEATEVYSTTYTEFVSPWHLPTNYDPCAFSVETCKVLPVVRIEQTGKNCWAASLAMGVCYYMGGCSPEFGKKVMKTIHEIAGVEYPEGISKDKLHYFEKLIWDKYFLSIDLDPDYRLTWEDIITEINAGRPLIALIDVSDLPYETKREGHMVVIVGYSENVLQEGKAVYVIDPDWVLPSGTGYGWYLWEDFKRWLVEPPFIAIKAIKLVKR